MYLRGVCVEEGLTMFYENRWKPWGGRLQFDVMKDFLTIKAVLNEVRALKMALPSWSSGKGEVSPGSVAHWPAVYTPGTWHCDCVVPVLE